MQRRDQIEPHRILVVWGTPDSLRLDQETRIIKELHRQSRQSEKYEVETATACTLQDLMHYLAEYRPNTVHFCGHGAGPDGIVCQDEAGKRTLISTATLASLFETRGDHVECVVLNVCFSEVQAEALAKHLDYVIGMKGAISDPAALSFSQGFYIGRFAGEDIPVCHQSGRTIIGHTNSTEHLTPVLKIREPRAKKHDIPTIAPPIVVDQRPQIPTGRRSFFRLLTSATVASAMGVTGWKLKAMNPDYPLDGIYHQKTLHDPTKIEEKEKSFWTGLKVKADSCILVVTHDVNGYKFIEITNNTLTLDRLNDQVIGGYVSTWRWREFKRTNSINVIAQPYKIDRGRLKELKFDGFAADLLEVQNFTKAKDWLDKTYGYDQISSWQMVGDVLEKKVGEQKDIFYKGLDDDELEKIISMKADRLGGAFG